MHSGKIRKQRREARIIAQLNRQGIVKLYNLAGQISTPKLGNDKPAKITYTGTGMALRNKDGRGKVLLEGESMGLSVAIEVVEWATENGFYLTNPEIFEGAYEL